MVTNYIKFFYEFLFEFLYFIINCNLKFKADNFEVKNFLVCIYFFCFTKQFKKIIWSDNYIILWKNFDQLHTTVYNREQIDFFQKNFWLIVYHLILAKSFFNMLQIWVKLETLKKVNSICHYNVTRASAFFRKIEIHISRN